jgi:hypothetical protein
MNRVVRQLVGNRGQYDGGEIIKSQKNIGGG